MSRLRALAAAHPYLVVYLAALCLAWAITLVSWSSAGMHPLAQLLQYGVVLLAATLAGYRVRVGDDRSGGGQATFGFYQYRATMTSDVGGTSFWFGLAAGVAAMLVNVVVLVGLDFGVALLTGRHAVPDGGLGAYLAWAGAGIAAGALLGVFSAFPALAAAKVLPRRR